MARIRQQEPARDPEGFEEDWALVRGKERKSYVGRRKRNGQCEVKVVQGSFSKRLPLARHLMSHSRGFEWGYAGSGPAQLALAILYDYLNNGAEARKYHQEFKALVVQGLPKDGWELTETLVEEALKMIGKNKIQGAHP